MNQTQPMVKAAMIKQKNTSQMLSAFDQKAAPRYVVHQGENSESLVKKQPGVYEEVLSSNEGHRPGLDTHSLAIHCLLRLPAGIQPSVHVRRIPAIKPASEEVERSQQ